VKAALPVFKKAIPEDVDVQLAFDQSGYVSNAISGLVREALLVACRRVNITTPAYI
jgi:multidrug efflux pump subunit AcrB